MSDQHPRCENCDFYRLRAPGRRHCGRFDFTMPIIGWSTLCKSWQHQGEGVDFDRMEDETLYYYSIGTGDLKTAILARMQDLQSMVISVNIRQDRELGWVILPRHNFNYFPTPDTPITIIVGNRRCKFQVINIERNLAIEMVPGENGWEPQYHTTQVFMLASLESGDLLYEWLDTFLHMGQYLEDSRLNPSIFAFIQVLSAPNTYSLTPDLLAYQAYMR